jgi:hypothetical protein
MADRLTLTRAFESAGLASGVAERVATEIYDAIHENVATKADINTLRAEMKADINALRAEMREVEQRIVIRLSAGAVVLAGLLFTALHYWPPHG